MKALTPAHVKIFITNSLKLRRIPYVSGPPGIGKSEIVYQIADEFGLKVIDIRLSQMLPEDLVGLPSLDETKGKATYNPFDTFPIVGDQIPDDYNGWLIFLDELSSATEEVMAAIYSLLLGHRIGNKQVHEKALIVAAGNRSTDSAIARPLPDTLISRMWPVEMKVSSKEWIRWAKNSGIPGHAPVVDYIEKYQDMLTTTISADKREELETFQSPRGWGGCFDIVNLHETNTQKIVAKTDSAGVPIGENAAENSEMGPDMKALLISAVGTIGGQGFFEHYNDTIKIPYPWEVAQSPSSVKIPSNGIGKAQLTSSLVEHFIKSQDQSRDAILKFMNRMPKEYSAVFVENIQEQVGESISDLSLIKEIKERLDYTEINKDKATKP